MLRASQLWPALVSLARAAAIIPSQLDGLRRKERVRELYRQHLSVSGGDGLAALAAAAKE